MDICFSSIPAPVLLSCLFNGQNELVVSTIYGLSLIKTVLFYLRTVHIYPFFLQGLSGIV